MELTDEQKETLILKLNSYKIHNMCNICSKNNWMLSDTIFELREYVGGGLVVGGKQSIFPVIPITCKNCGNTLFINTIASGIFNPAKKGDKNE